MKTKHHLALNLTGFNVTLLKPVQSRAQCWTWPTCFHRIYCIYQCKYVSGMDMNEFQHVSMRYRFAFMFLHVIYVVQKLACSVGFFNSNSCYFWINVVIYCIGFLQLLVCIFVRVASIDDKMVPWALALD